MIRRVPWALLVLLVTLVWGIGASARIAGRAAWAALVEGRAGVRAVAERVRGSRAC